MFLVFIIIIVVNIVIVIVVVIVVIIRIIIRTRWVNLQLRWVAKKLLYHSSVVGDAIFVVQEIVLWIEILLKSFRLQKFQQTLNAVVDSIAQFVMFPVAFLRKSLAFPQPRVLHNNVMFTVGLTNSLVQRRLRVTSGFQQVQTWDKMKHNPQEKPKTGGLCSLINFTAPNYSIRNVTLNTRPSTTITTVALPSTKNGAKMSFAELARLMLSIHQTEMRLLATTYKALQGWSDKLKLLSSWLETSIK